MEEFLDLLRGSTREQATLDAYRQGLVQYSEWLEMDELAPEDATTRDIKRFLSWLKSERGYAPNTIRTRYSAVSEYYKDLSDVVDDLENPVEDVRVADFAPPTTKREEVTKEERVWLSKEEVTELVENVPAPTVRNRLVILFQYFTGLRVGEVSDVKLSDLDRDNRRVQVRGKNDVVHTAHWQPKLDGLLTAWIDKYRSSSTYASESQYLFLTSSSPQLSAVRINDIVVEAAEEAGIQEVLYRDANGRKRRKVTSHTLRHSFAMHWLQNGGTLEGLSHHLAHSSQQTTEIYGEILDERAEEEYEKFAPDIDF